MSTQVIRWLDDSEVRWLEGVEVEETDQLGQTDQVSEGIPTWWKILSVAGAALSAYHGYARNRSVGWAIVWGVLGGLFPVITVPVAIAQGFGKPART